MSKEEFFGVTDKDIYNFVEACSSKEDGFLHITTQALADTFVLMCKKFQGASILEFYYTTENQNGRIMYKRKNDLYLHLGLHVFLPDLRFGETYVYDVTLLFKDIFEVSYNPIDINENTEIEIDSFTVTQNECLFSCNAKDNKKRKFSVKAKELLVENYITPEDAEDDDEILEDESVNSKKEETVKPLTAFELATKRFEEKNYNDCIHILKYQYKNLNEDADANNILSLCFAHLNNPNEAVNYINKAIELDNTRCYYFANKGIYLCKLNCHKDAIKCFNDALEKSPDEEHTRKYTKDIIDLVNLKIQFYSPYDLLEVEKFEEYILYFDSIINLEFCFPEYREKFKELKHEAVSHFYERTKTIFENQFHSKNYQNIANRCKSILNVSNLDEKIKIETQNIYEKCNQIVNKESNKNNFVEDLFKKGYSVDEIVEAFNSKFNYKIYDYEVKSMIEKIKTKRGVDIPINPLPPLRDKRSAISEMMDEEYTKAEMVEQLSSDFGISEESALATINSYYKDDDLQLGDYFGDFDDDDIDYEDDED